MYDARNVIIGLCIFVIMVTFPFWYSLASSTSSYKPDPIMPKHYKKCVEDNKTMRELHMDLLDMWRHKVVRESKRYYSATDKSEHEMSLSKNCMKCHTSKVDFCDKCHNYAGVDMYCFDCHSRPKGRN